MTARKLMLFCSVHGASTTRAKCSLSASVRGQWRKQAAKRSDDGEGFILTSVEMSDPSHGAVCAVERTVFHGLLDDCAHERMARRCLKSAIRSAKLQKTKAAKRKASV